MNVNIQCLYAHPSAVNSYNNNKFIKEIKKVLDIYLTRVYHVHMNNRLHKKRNF